MKTTTSLLKTKVAALIAITCLATASIANAGNSTYDAAIAATPADTGFYFDGFGGLLFLDDLSGSGSANVDAEFDTGWLAGGTLGYELNSALSLEIEGATGEADLEGLAINRNQLSQFNGDLSLTQVAVNLIYEFENQSSFTPYLGFGIGGAFVDADFRYPGNSISDDDAGLYYQFIGGVSVDLSPRASLFAEYRYGTIDEFSLQRGGGTVDFDELNAHQAKFGVQIKF